ncbi:MAG: glycosyltransferase, partial [Acidimicrobiia bacterium]
LLHHHDLAWQRGGHPEITELPPRLPDALHVTINEQSRIELADRGLGAVLVRNGFDLDAPLGDREATRSRLGVGESDLLVLQPTRALARKNIPGALSLCAELARAMSPQPCVRYWLAGPSEDGYAPTVDRLLAEAPVPVLRTRPSSMSDAYAACDLVAFPSTDEGFGNPVVESVWAGRPLAVGHYPVLSEIRSLGFSFLDAGDPEAVAAWIGSPRPETLASNLELAREHFSLPALTRRLGQVMTDAGWMKGAPEPRGTIGPPGEPAR